MTGLLLVLAVIVLSLLVTRVASAILTLTGMSRESARFQARSALTGVGFTTSEAEAVVGHPIRRRVVLALMLLGSAGVVTAIASLIVSFGGASGGERLVRGLILLGGLVALLALSRSATFDRVIRLATTRLMRARGLDARDYAALLQLAGGYRVGELQVREGDWVAGRTLGELRLRDEGVVVLGVHRGDGSYLGVPDRDTLLRPGDTLLVYGHRERLAELDRRSGDTRGDATHRAAARELRRERSGTAATAGGDR